MVNKLMSTAGGGGGGGRKKRGIDPMRLPKALSNMAGLPGMVTRQAMGNYAAQTPAPAPAPGNTSGNTPGIAPGTSQQELRGANRMGQAQLGLARNAVAGVTRDTNRLHQQNQQALSRMNATVQAGDPQANPQNYQAFAQGTGGNASQYKALYGDRAWFGQGQRPENYSPGERGNAIHGQHLRGTPITQQMPAGPEVDADVQRQAMQNAGIPGQGVELTGRQFTDQAARDTRAKDESDARKAKGGAYKDRMLDKEMARRERQRDERIARKEDRAKDRTTGQGIGTHSDRRYQDDREQEKLDDATNRQHGLMDNQQAHELDVAKVAALTQSASRGDTKALSGLNEMFGDNLKALHGRRSKLDDAINSLPRDMLSGEVLDTATQDRLSAERDRVEAQIETHERQQRRAQSRIQYSQMKNDPYDSGQINNLKAWLPMLQTPQGVEDAAEALGIPGADAAQIERFLYERFDTKYGPGMAQFVLEISG